MTWTDDDERFCREHAANRWCPEHIDSRDLPCMCDEFVAAIRAGVERGREQGRRELTSMLGRVHQARDAIAHLERMIKACGAQEEPLPAHLHAWPRKCNTPVDLCCKDAGHDGDHQGLALKWNRNGGLIWPGVTK